MYTYQAIQNFVLKLKNLLVYINVIIFHKCIIVIAYIFSLKRIHNIKRKAGNSLTITRLIKLIPLFKTQQTEKMLRCEDETLRSIKQIIIRIRTKIFLRKIHSFNTFFKKEREN